MTYKGHVANGVVVLDEPAPLDEGTEVRIEFVTASPHTQGSTPLRGTPYRFEDPFSPAMADLDWESVG